MACPAACPAGGYGVRGGPGCGAVTFGAWATVTGSSAVFGRLTGLAGVFSLVLAVAVAAAGMLAWARRPAGRHLSASGAAVAAGPPPDGADLPGGRADDDPRVR